jgi:hypothetical protein
MAVWFADVITMRAVVLMPLDALPSLHRTTLADQEFCRSLGAP